MALYNSNGMEKNPQDRQRRNKDDYVIDYVEWDGKLHGPPLPRGRKWTDETRDWWAGWRKSPQAMVMTDTDWAFLLDTALLHNLLWKEEPEYTGEGRRPNGGMTLTQLAGEVRQRVSKFGATYEDRKKLKMAIDTPASLAREELDIDGEAEKAIDYAERLQRAAAKKK